MGAGNCESIWLGNLERLMKCLFYISNFQIFDDLLWTKNVFPYDWAEVI